MTAYKITVKPKWGSSSYRYEGQDQGIDSGAGRSVFQEWLKSNQAFDEVENDFHITVERRLDGYKGSYTLTYDFDIVGDDATNEGISSEDEARLYLESHYQDEMYSTLSDMEITDLYPIDDSSYKSLEW